MFITTATVMYSLGHGLRTLIAVPRHGHLGYYTLHLGYYTLDVHGLGRLSSPPSTGR